jgi:predicted outer membrane repeat protein
VRPKLEVLEDRFLLNGNLYLVTSGADSGTGSLRAAVAEAGDNDSISFSINGPPEVYLNSPITLTQNNLSIDTGSVAVTISGQNKTRIFEVASGSTSISGLTFTEGAAATGGAILVDSGASLWLDSNTFSNNNATTNIGGTSTSGGAITNNGSLTLNNFNQFDNNNAIGGSGGGLGTGGAIENFNSLTIESSNIFNDNSASTDGGAISSDDSGAGSVIMGGNNTFTNNFTQNGNGGAIAMSDSLSVNQCSFNNNQAGTTSTDGDGGAIFSSYNNGTINVQNSNFQGNVANQGKGGAIITKEGLTLNNNIFKFNQAVANAGVGGNGGAIYINGTGLLTDTGSRYGGNLANGGKGGAIDTYTTTTLTDDTFDSTNEAKAINSNGGIEGALTVEPPSQTNVNGCAFDNNTADAAGGAIENFGQLVVNVSTAQASSFFQNNAGTTGGAIDSFSNIPTPAGALQVYSATFYGNVASSSGGAIDTGNSTTLTNDGFGDAADPNVAGSATANSALGGAVNAVGANGSFLYVNLCTFANNRVVGMSTFGGAIATSANTDVEQSVFTTNSTQAANKTNTGEGGAIAFQITNPQSPIPSLKVNRDTFMSNTTISDGGAVYTKVAVHAGTVNITVINSTFSSNQAPDGSGGGLDVNQSTSETGSSAVTLTNDTFFANLASTGGGLAFGGLINIGTGTNTATLTSLTVNQNSANNRGGGMALDLSPNVGVTNSIFDGNLVNVPGYTGPLDVFVANDGSSVTDDGWNLVGVSDTMFSIIAFDIIDKNNNPGLANALADNNALPGYPQTLAVQPGSLALGAGDPSLEGTLDERGRTRQAGKVTIGAEDPNAI